MKILALVVRLAGLGLSALALVYATAPTRAADPQPIEILLAR